MECLECGQTRSTDEMATHRQCVECNEMENQLQSNFQARWTYIQNVAKSRGLSVDDPKDSHWKTMCELLYEMGFVDGIKTVQKIHSEEA